MKVVAAGQARGFSEVSFSRGRSSIARNSRPLARGFPLDAIAGFDRGRNQITTSLAEDAILVVVAHRRVYVSHLRHVWQGFGRFINKY